MQLLTINEAAQSSGKSIQTIRRMIKQKKVRIKKQKTPQGFNYLIIKESLDNFLSSYNHPDKRDYRPIDKTSGTGTHTTQEDSSKFSDTLHRLIEQHARDKENFFNLIKTFQDRVLILENQIKMLEAPKNQPAKRRFWQFWE